ncbi:hypothetical protein Agub_g9674, partial [Astrephomene gubernaculifera]
AFIVVSLVAPTQANVDALPQQQQQQASKQPLPTQAAAKAPLTQQPNSTSTPFSCERLDRVPRPQRCEFVRQQCDSDSLLPYTEWYYCHVAPYGVFASVIFALLLSAALPLLFTLLGDTAELYFSPIMTHVAQSIPKMRPRFAGVTFVAMGNAAPDLSSNISAVRNGGVLLSAGALTGAAMFVQCVVAAEVMRASRGPIKCRGAMLRDVAIYCACVLLVLGAFAHGRITYCFIAGAVLLYLSYIVWVFAGDEWHERGRPRAGDVWSRFRAAAEDRFGSRRGLLDSGGLLPWAAVEEGGAGSRGGGGEGPSDMATELTSPLISAAPHGSGGEHGLPSRPTSPSRRLSAPLPPHQPHHHHHHLMSAKTYQSLVWADLTGPEEPAAAGAAGDME